MITDEAISDASLLDITQTIMISLEKGTVESFKQAIFEVVQLMEVIHGHPFVKESKKKLLNSIVVKCLEDYLIKYKNRSDENIRLGLMNFAVG